MRTDQFDYDLPRRLIAQYPLSERSSSKLLVVDRKTRGFSHARFSDLRDLLRPGDLMVLNNTRVIPARLAGQVERRGTVEFLLTEKKDETRWKVLFRNPAEGLRVSLDGGVTGRLEREPDKSWTIRFSGPVERVIADAGRMPLPPYIAREPEPSDKKTYQTVYRDRGRGRRRSDGRTSFRPGTYLGTLRKGRSDELCHSACGRGDLQAREGRVYRQPRDAFRARLGSAGDRGGGERSQGREKKDYFRRDHGHEGP